MVGRKAAKSGSKKLRVSSDLKAKTMKKLKAREKENQLNPNALTRDKALVIDSRGQQKGRLIHRVFGADLASCPDELADTILLLRDGLLQKRLEGLAKIAVLLVSDEVSLPKWARRVMSELGPRVVDDERTVRQYAVQLMIDFCQCVRKHMEEHGREWADTAAALSSSARAHLRAAFTTLRKSVARDGVIYAHQMLIHDETFAEEDEFTRQILPLLLSHDNLLRLPGAVRTEGAGQRPPKQLWSCVQSFQGSLAPILSDWGALFLGAVLLSFASICDESVTSANAVTFAQIVKKLSWPSLVPIEPAAAPLAGHAGTPVRRSRDDFKEVTTPGSNFVVGRLLLSVDAMIVACGADADQQVTLKVACLAIYLLRWIISISFGAELTRRDDRISGTTLPPSSSRARHFYTSAVTAGLDQQYGLFWLLDNMGVATTIRSVAKLIHRADQPSTKFRQLAICHLECLVAEVFQAVEVVIGSSAESASLRKTENRLREQLGPLTVDSPYLGSGEGIVEDTYMILYKVFGEGAVPLKKRAIAKTLLSALQVQLARDRTEVIEVADEINAKEGYSKDDNCAANYIDGASTSTSDDSDSDETAALIAFARGRKGRC